MIPWNYKKIYEIWHLLKDQSHNHVTVTEAASAEDSTDAFIEAENIGYLNIDNVVAESMSRHFCMGISAVNIQDSTLMSKDSCIFWISDAGIK